MADRLVPSTDGVTVAVHDLGGSGHELLYAHATGFHGHVWLPFAAHLADRYHGWALDFRGHGESTRPAGDAVEWPGFGRDCTAAIDALGLRSPFGLGHSKGAAALLMAEIARPGTFAALAVYEPVVFPALAPAESPDDGPSMVGGARRRRAVFDSFEAAEANFSSKPPLSVLHRDALTAYVRHGFAERADGTVRLRCEPEFEARTYEGGSRHDTWEHLGRVVCPVLVMSGRHGGRGAGAVAHELSGRIPGARHHAFAQLGHFGPLEDPPTVAAVVREFFAASRHG